MDYRVELRPAAQRDLRKLDPHIRKRISRDILALEKNPRPQGVEKLASEEELYRVCIGAGKDYRVIYQIRDQILLVLVIAVGNRKEVYRHLK